ncbi:MAG TPA: hypothetical protein VFX30_03240 [bacterium]|nr:hypothetical protein [bacterium]
MKRFPPFVFPAILILFLSSLTAAASPPRFEDFPVTEKFTGTPAAPALTDPDTKRFKTRLTDASKGEPDFAGSFIVAKWGCGSGCLDGAILDAKTGRVFFFPFTVVSPIPNNTGWGIEYRRDSSLFVVRGSRGEEEAPGVFYYRWDGKKLVPLP